VNLAVLPVVYAPDAESVRTGCTRAIKAPPSRSANRGRRSRRTWRKRQCGQTTKRENRCRCSGCRDCSCCASTRAHCLHCCSSSRRAPRPSQQPPRTTPVRFRGTPLDKPASGIIAAWRGHGEKIFSTAAARRSAADSASGNGGRRQNAKTDDEVPVDGKVPVAPRRARIDCKVVPAAAAHHARQFGGIHFTPDRLFRIVQAPFPDVP